MERIKRRRHMRFPGFKLRALTFSYDDGVKQDRRLIEIMKKNGKKTYSKNPSPREKASSHEQRRSRFNKTPY